MLLCAVVRKKLRDITLSMTSLKRICLHLFLIREKTVSPKSQQNTKENEPMKKIQIYYDQY